MAQLIARLAIQCRTPDQSETGTFLFFGEQGQPYASCDLASPVFPDLASLAPWMNQNGWTASPYDPEWPCGVYRKQAAPEALRPTLTQIFDHNHEWLIVTPAQLAAVGLTEADISKASYRYQDRIALEGDCDAARFLTAYAKLFGHIPLIREREACGLPGDDSPRTWASFGTKVFDPETFTAGIDYELLHKLYEAEVSK